MAADVVRGHVAQALRAERRQQRPANLVAQVAQVVGQHHELDHGPDQHPDRVGVDLVVLRERGREPG